MLYRQVYLRKLAAGISYNRVDSFYRQLILGFLSDEVLKRNVFKRVLTNLNLKEDD